MRDARALLGALALTLPLLTAPGAPEPTVDVLLGERLRIPIADLAERVPLAPDQEFRVVEIGRDTGTSQHLVAIRHAEVPHRHDRHDLFVVMVQGSGTWRRWGCAGGGIRASSCAAVAASEVVFRFITAPVRGGSPAHFPSY